MIECTDKFIWYKKKRLKKPKKLIAFFLVLIIIISISIYYRTVVSALVFDLCVDYSEKYSTQAVNDAILLNMSNDINYADLITVEKNSNGEVVLMSANSVKVNFLSREIINDTAKLLEEKLKSGIPVPLFAFSGIGALSGYGKPINYKAIAISKVECKFNSDFKAVGINQTLHSIYAIVISSINSKAFLSNKKIVCESKVLISETVLIGKVPDIYLNGKLFNQ